MNLTHKLALCWRILRHKPTDLEAHLLRELQEKEEGPNKWMRDSLHELVVVFGTQGHSGMSAGYCTSMLARVLRYKPLSPLTGGSDEWIQHAPDYPASPSSVRRRCN